MKTYRNILVVRTDRIGDVVLSTPAIAALKKTFPQSRLSVLIAPATLEIMEENPHIDEIIVDDRKGIHKGFSGFCRLVSQVSSKRFDLAVVFHTKKRTNLICYFAGIPERIGYQNNKFGFLLTKKIPDTRPQGVKHEAQYCLDVLKAIGMEVPGGLSADRLLLPIKKEYQDWAVRFLEKNGMRSGNRLIAIHPGASCISKRWMPESFAQVADDLVSRYNCQVLLIGGKENEEIVKKMKITMKSRPINATAMATVGQSAALLKHCQLLISNDSGPVHMAAALGVPVISIFGRNQAGLSPLRWKPLGEKNIILHKEVGCPVCLAHNCQIDFKCLKEISSNEVLEAVDALARLW